MNAKRILSLVLALLMMLPAAAALAEVDLTPKSNEITIWYLNNDETAILYDDFARLHPEYTLNHDVETTIAGWDVIMADLAAMTASGNVPDAIYIQLPTFIGYYSDFFQPIDRFVRNDPELNIADLESSIMDCFCLFNGEYWFMPDEYNCDCFIWNKDMFEEAGLDPDVPPQTFSELLEYAKKLNRFDSNGTPTQLGYSGYSWNNGMTTFYAFLASGYGKAMADRVGLNYELNTEEIKSLLQLGWDIIDSYGGRDKLPADVSFDIANGNAAMQEYMFNWLPDLLRSTDIEFGVALNPHAEGMDFSYVNNSPGLFWAIPKGAKNPEGGWEWIKYWYTDGQIATETARAEQDISRWMPEFVLHKPTRDTINDMLLPLVEDEDILMLVDFMYETYAKTSPIYSAAGYEANFANPYFWPLFRKIEKKEVDMNSGLEELQNIADRLRDEWMAQKKEAGWNFDVEEGMFPIPPAN